MMQQVYKESVFFNALFTRFLSLYMWLYAPVTLKGFSSQKDKKPQNVC